MSSQPHSCVDQYAKNKANWQLPDRPMLCPVNSFSTKATLLIVPVPSPALVTMAMPVDITPKPQKKRNNRKSILFPHNKFK